MSREDGGPGGCITTILIGMVVLATFGFIDWDTVGDFTIFLISIPLAVLGLYCIFWLYTSIKPDDKTDKKILIQEINNQVKDNKPIELDRGTSQPIITQFKNSSDNEASMIISFETELIPDQPLLQKTISTQLLKLDSCTQAKVLSIFFQVEHNNPFFSKYQHSFLFLDGYPSFGEGYGYLKQFFEQCENGIHFIISDIRTIEDIPELFRLIFIIESFSGTTEDQEAAKQACKDAWKLDQHGIKSYFFNILKSEADILINQGRHIEAARVLQPSYTMLIPMDGLHFLKYQYAKVLLEISNNVNLYLDYEKLLEGVRIHSNNARIELRGSSL